MPSGSLRAIGVCGRASAGVGTVDFTPDFRFAWMSTSSSSSDKDTWWSGATKAKSNAKAPDSGASDSSSAAKSPELRVQKREFSAQFTKWYRLPQSRQRRLFLLTMPRDSSPSNG